MLFHVAMTLRGRSYKRCFEFCNSGHPNPGPQPSDRKPISLGNLVRCNLKSSGKFGNAYGTCVEFVCINHVLIVRILDYGPRSCPVSSKVTLQLSLLTPAPLFFFVFVKSRKRTHDKTTLLADKCNSSFHGIPYK